MEKRIITLRKDLGFTQQEFSNRTGIARSTICNYEKGRSTPTNAVIEHICNLFSVSENWLRYGEGEMYVKKSRSEAITDFLTELLKEEDFSYKRELIEMISQTTLEEWKVIFDFNVKLAQIPSVQDKVMELKIKGNNDKMDDN